MVQRKPNNSLEICKAFQDRLTFLSLDWLESFDFEKFTENIGLPAIYCFENLDRLQAI